MSIISTQIKRREKGREREKDTLQIWFVVCRHNEGEKDCSFVSLRGRLSRKALCDLILFISNENDASIIVYVRICVYHYSFFLFFIYYNISSCTKAIQSSPLSLLKLIFEINCLRQSTDVRAHTLSLTLEKRRW